jgi:hypothetical protein
MFEGSRVGGRDELTSGAISEVSRMTIWFLTGTGPVGTAGTPRR